MTGTVSIKCSSISQKQREMVILDCRWTLAARNLPIKYSYVTQTHNYKFDQPPSCCWLVISTITTNTQYDMSLNTGMVVFELGEGSFELLCWSVDVGVLMLQC